MSTQEPRVSVIIPLYNEETGIRGLLEKMAELKFLEKYDVLVVDDGSTDGSLETVRQFPVRFYSHPANKGYGAALKTGIRRAKGEKIVILDSDGQHDPAHIPQVEDMLDTYEMVIGTRDKDSFQVKTRQMGKRVIRWVGEYLVEQKLPDYNSGYRGFNRSLIKEMLHIMPNGFSFSTTSTLAFLKEGYSIGTFPITVKERVGRKSNLKFFKDGSKTMMLILRIIMLFNPLKIFFPASLITILAGMLFGVYGFITAERFSNSAIVLTVLGMFLFFIGLVADQISILNRKH
jgi:glycosyltransferase involved in cell wall biosynthesis